MQAYRSSIFHCVEKNGAIKGEYFVDGLLIIDEGRVVEVGAYQVLSSNFSKENIAQITVLNNCLIIPGLIDTHLHYPQYKIIASFGKTLLDWLNDYTFIEEQKFNQQEYANNIAELFYSELLRNGTTTAMSFCTSHPHSVNAFFSVAHKYNMRMLGGKVMMNRNAPDGLCDTVESSYQDSKELIEKWHNKGRLLYSVSPRFAPTCCTEQLTMAAKLMQEYEGNNSQAVRMQTHLNENIDEIEWVKSLYPEHKSYFDVYEQHQLAGEFSVFGHCIYGTDEEFKRLGETGSKVALCPSSNLFLGSGLFDLQKLEHYGVDCAIASDIGGGDSFSLFKTINEAYKICALQGYRLDSIKGLYLCTLGAAKVLNLEHCLGNFEAGKEADFVVLNLQATQLISERIATTKNIEELLFSLITLGDDRLVDEVYIYGKKVI
jgi:guanine deaminase